MTVSQHTLSSDAGTFFGNIAMVHFVQWHLPTMGDPTDEAVPNGDCIDLPGVTMFNVHWP